MSKDLTDYLDALTRHGSNDDNSLPALKPRGPTPAAKSSGVDKPTQASGGGVASPLTEASFAAREYYPEQAIPTTDGLFAYRAKPIKKIIMTDANDSQVVFVFAAPSA
ncbi:MAG: hypothetical protein WAV95_15785 [Azonexus sp.]